MGGYTPQQRSLTPEEAARVAGHPLEVRLGRRVLAWLGWSAGGARGTWREMATAIPMVAFRPRD